MTVKNLWGSTLTDAMERVMGQRTIIDHEIDCDPGEDAARQWWNLTVDLKLDDQCHGGTAEPGNVSPVYARVEVWFQSVHTESNDSLFYESRGRATEIAKRLGDAEIITVELEPADEPPYTKDSE